MSLTSPTFVEIARLVWRSCPENSSGEFVPINVLRIYSEGVEMATNGKVAVVTGGNRGIGRGIAEALTREGLTVALTARDGATAREAATQVGHGARGYTCDVRRQ